MHSSIISLLSASYGNDIGNIGSLQGHKPGKYLVRISDDNFGFFSGPPPDNESHWDYRGYINFPTAYGICLARIATTPTIRDQGMTNQFQDQIQVSPIKWPGRHVAPPLDLSMFSLPEHRPSGKASVVPAVLRLTAALAPCNMSPILQDRPWISDILKASGIG